MEKFAQQPADEKEAYFTQAASQLSLPPYVVETDFWVCWTLKRLFGLGEISDTILFKGGTSLSKVHGLIRRFSEDIDVSIHRDKLGFSGDRDPLSNKQQGKLKEQLSTAARTYIAETIRPQLQAAIAEHGRPADRPGIHARHVLR